MVSLIAQGLSNAEIAGRTYLSPNSVKSYIRSAYRKIGVQRRSQAVAWGIDHGMVPNRSRHLVEPTHILPTAL
ncbi:response regulator transcription factor [Luteococcus peritonei]